MALLTTRDGSGADPVSVRDGATTTAAVRLILSATSLLAIGTGLAGLVLGTEWMRTSGLLIYAFLGIGAAPTALNRRIALWPRLAAVALTALCSLVLISTAMLQLGAWHPALAMGAAAALTVPMHVIACLQAGRQLRLPSGNLLSTVTRQTRPGGTSVRRPSLTPAIAPAVSGAVFCAAAALTHRHTRPALWGLLVDIGPWWYIGLALIVVSVAMSRSRGEAALAISVLLLAAALIVTPTLVYDGPRAVSAAKHIDFVRQIQQSHRLQSSVPVYDGWPGYFAAMAWLCDVAGLKDPFGLATAWPVLVGALRLTSMRFFAGVVLRSPVQAWLAVALGLLADPMGMDYFSPQSVGIVLGLLAFGIALSDLTLPPKAGLLTVIGCTVTVAHQLSPYMIGGVLCVLVVFRQIRPWWLPGTVVLPAVVWAIWHQSALRGFLSLGGIGKAGNFRPPRTTATPGLERHPALQASIIALVLGILILGVVALWLLIRQRRSRRTWAFAMCPAVGLLVIAINAYGNEGLFRTALFALPWLALLAAQMFHERPSWRLNIGSTTLLATLLSTFLVGAFSMDATNVLRPSDMRAFQFYEDHHSDSPEGSYLLVVGLGDYPMWPVHHTPPYNVVGRQTIEEDDVVPRNEPAEHAVARLTQDFLRYAGQSPNDAEEYVLWSPLSLYYGWEYGLYTPEGFEAIRDAFRASPHWRTVYESQGTELFRYVPDSRSNRAVR